MATTTNTKTREILVILNGGRRRKVSGRDSNALRIYTTTNNQLAVFVGVQEFRDLSLTVQEEKGRLVWQARE